MKTTIEVPEYDPQTGLSYKWENNFEIVTKVENGVVIINANKAGLVSLANHLLNLAQDNVPVGHHMHFDPINSLNEGSVELIIEKGIPG